MADGQRGLRVVTASLAGAGEVIIWRTGAPAGTGSRYLARPGARRVGIVGSGRQARGQLLAVRRAVPSLESARVYSPTKDHREAFAQRMSAWLEVEPVETPKKAVLGPDIVRLATSFRSPVIEPGWIEPGALVVSITSGQMPERLKWRPFWGRSIR